METFPNVKLYFEHKLISADLEKGHLSFLWWVKLLVRKSVWFKSRLLDSHYDWNFPIFERMVLFMIGEIGNQWIPQCYMFLGWIFKIKLLIKWNTCTWLDKLKARSLLNICWSSDLLQLWCFVFKVCNHIYGLAFFFTLGLTILLETLWKCSGLIVSALTSRWSGDWALARDFV